MMDLEGNEIDVTSATNKFHSYRYFGIVKFLSNIKQIFDKPPRSEELEEV